MRLEQAARQGDQDEVSILRQRLIDLGYEHVSLALDVERALEDKKDQEALRHSHRLAGLLPPDEPRSLASLVRHVSLLAGFWQVNEAQRMWNLIAGRDHDALDKLLEEFPWLESPSDTNHMIESPVKIEEMVAAANILGQSFGGNYLVNPLKRSICDAEGISAGAIADAFNAEADAAGGEMELKAVTRQYQHLSSQGAGEIQMVLFEDEKSPGANTIFALGLRRAGSIMEIIPGFIFRWQANGDHLASNNAAIKALHDSMKDQSLGSKADSAFNAAKQIIRRAVTKARFKREV